MSRAQFVMALAAVTLVFAACEGSGASHDEFPRVVTLGEGEVFPSVLNTALAVGENRLVLALDDADDERILGAAVQLEFFDLNGDAPQRAFDATARFVPVELSYIDEQSGGAREVVGDDGVYVAYVDFTRAGDWGMNVRVTEADGNALERAPSRFNVRDRTPEPMVGEPAPASVQPTLATEPDINEIDSSEPPRPHMHGLTIADALASGRPSVIAFATPAFCFSRTCAPVMDSVMDGLYARYADRANFIHVEPYVLRDLRNGLRQTALPVTREWRLESEPWVFVVDSSGRVAGKFQGVVAVDEVESVLLAALGG
jgi:hypothetical protein